MVKRFLINENHLRMLRYIVVGGMTTFVSFSTYWLLYKHVEIEPNLANVISIIIAVLFAYITNKIFVFKNKVSSFKDLIIEFMRFVSSRGITMLIEIIGVYIALEVYNLHELLSKGIVSIIVLVLNYLLSRFFVFRNTDLFQNKEKY